MLIAAESYWEGQITAENKAKKEDTLQDKLANQAVNYTARINKKYALLSNIYKI